MAARSHDVVFGLAGLALPVLAGLAAMALTGAPRGFLMVNGIALALSLGLALLPLRPSGQARLVTALVILAVLAAVALVAPPLDGVRRWIVLGPVRLHAGMLLGPALAVLAAKLDRAPISGLLAAALLVAAVQPDLALALAIGGTALALVRTTSDLVLSAMIAAAGIAAATLRGDPLAPVPHVEGVIAQVWQTSPPGAAVLLLAQLAPVVAFLRYDQRGRACAGFWGGLVLASLIGPWPSPLIGAGAAPILGYGFALALART